jgi:hypothetical protein
VSHQKLFTIVEDQLVCYADQSSRSNHRAKPEAISTTT